LGTYNGPYDDTADGGSTSNPGFTTGSVEADTCLACPEGLSCSDRGTIEPSAGDSCPAGYYCNTGPTIACPAGHFCSTANNNEAGAPYKCGDDISLDASNKGSFGKYTPFTMQSTCDWCPAGFYCPSPYNYAIICPPGNFCPQGTYELTDDNKCSVGYFTDKEGTTASYKCLDCQEGYICATTGIEEMTDSIKCLEGNYCPAGSRSAIPCIAGHYCEEGSSYQQTCAVGTYNDDSQSINSDACVNCPADKYCAKQGMV
jgi:hypothetical protein